MATAAAAARRDARRAEVGHGGYGGTERDTGARAEVGHGAGQAAGVGAKPPLTLPGGAAPPGGEPAVRREPGAA